MIGIITGMRLREIRALPSCFLFPKDIECPLFARKTRIWAELKVEETEKIQIREVIEC
jgi:hypothetical protein